jgi:hypothetical protein
MRARLERIQARVRSVRAFLKDPLGLGDFSIDFGDAFGEVEPPGPHRVVVSGVLARLHSVAHGDPRRLHTLFVDNEAKLAAQERFAAGGFHCGHFFAAGAAGARSEAAHYGIDVHERFLLEVDMEISEILDLTNHEALNEAIASQMDLSTIGSRPYTGLLMLMDQTSGGNGLTDDLGIEALRAGCRGVRFFGARAIGDSDYNEMLMARENIWPDDEARTIASLRRKPDVTNIVVFSASDVVRHARRHRVNGGAWIENPLWASTEAEYAEACARDGIPPSVVRDPQDWFRMAPPEDGRWISPRFREMNGPGR